jgi:hypothetical protein
MADIQLGKPKVLGIDSEASGLINVEIELEPQPDGNWLNVFRDGPPGPMWPMSMHPPRLQGSKVILRPPDNEVEMYLNALGERVEATNAYYEREIAPRLRQQEERRKADEAERQRRIEEAQKLLDERSA